MAWIGILSGYFHFSSCRPCVCAKLHQLCPTLCDPMDFSPQAPLSLGFFKQDYWSELPCPSPGYLPDSGIEPTSLLSPALAGRFFTTSITWEAQTTGQCSQSEIILPLGIFISVWRDTYFIYNLREKVDFSKQNIIQEETKTNTFDFIYKSLHGNNYRQRKHTHSHKWGKCWQHHKA